MKTKYMMNRGSAFAEKHDLRKLEQLATKGWLLNGFAWGGFLYELVPGPKQELAYSLDMQPNPDADYFEIYKAAGWSHVTSGAKQFHIFSAPKGTAPIYSGNEIEEGKYAETTSMFGKCALYSFLALIICILAVILSKSQFALLYYLLIGVTFISLAAFISSFMPYVAYKFKEKKNK